jgi:hypothetical protein
LELIVIWKRFVSIVKNKDTLNFNHLSTKVVTITNYYGEDSGYKYDAVRDTVRSILFENLSSSNIWSLMEQKNLILSFGTSRDFARYKLKPNKQNKYKIFEVRFDGDNEKPDDHFGISCSFKFIKSDNSYYFNELSILRN